MSGRQVPDAAALPQELPAVIGSDEWIERKLGWLRDRAPKPPPRGLQEARRRGLAPEYIARPAPRSLAELLESGRVRKQVLENLHHGRMEAPRAIVLHRTAGSTAAGALSTFRNGRIGTHFLIDNDGTIYQTAELGQRTKHVGLVRSRAKKEEKMTAEDKAFFNELARASRALGNGELERIHAMEQRKSYPVRYPVSEDSYGIEVVGRFDEATQTFVAATPRQQESLRELVELLKSEYGLGNQDIYRHGLISYKKEDEGNGLGY